MAKKIQRYYDTLLVFLCLAVCSSLCRALVSFTSSLSDFLHLAVCSSVSRTVAALTSLFLDAFLVVSGLLSRNTWPHGQASFLTWIWQPQLGHTQNKENYLEFQLLYCRSREQCHTSGLCIENRPMWTQKPFCSVRSRARSRAIVLPRSQTRVRELVLRLEYGQLVLTMANESQHNS